MSDKHTSEPWILDGTRITSVHKSVYPFTIAETFGDSYDADARRIVACVNACKGISTKDLETLYKNGFRGCLAI